MHVLASSVTYTAMALQFTFTPDLNYLVEVTIRIFGFTCTILNTVNSPREVFPQFQVLYSLDGDNASLVIHRVPEQIGDVDVLWTGTVGELH